MTIALSSNTGIVNKKVTRLGSYAGNGFVEILALIIALAIGVVAAMRVPALVFALIVVCVACVYIVTQISLNGFGLGELLWATVYVFAIEGGYVAGHVIRYFFRENVSKEASDETPSGEEASYPSQHRGSRKS